MEYDLCCTYNLGCVAFYWSVVNLPVATFLMKIDFSSPSSYQLQITLQQGVGFCVYLPSLHWKFVVSFPRH